MCSITCGLQPPSGSDEQNKLNWIELKTSIFRVSSSWTWLTSDTLSSAMQHTNNMRNVNVLCPAKVLKCNIQKPFKVTGVKVTQ